ncbi:cytochrome P450 2J6 [Folsomia candida]|uniref:cytochrome P450 2J6 n=1 Tax=Folsomia candida TaxID=158441 RepID=UPI001605001A|nr:cytochrome P450 2J6 [Folsomia candida]
MVALSFPLLIVCGVVAVLFYYKVIKRSKKGTLDGIRPPGPRGLPFLGNVLQLEKKNPFMSFVKWAEEYGDVYSVKMLYQNVVIVSDLKMVKEMFSQEPAFAGRMNPAGGVNDLYTNGQMHGVINTEGRHWEGLRRFTLRQLRDFGFGKSTMEALIMDELEEILDWMKSKEGLPVTNIKERMSVAVVNSLWTVVSGKRYKHDDPAILKLTKDLTETMEELAKRMGPEIMLPWLKYLGFKGLVLWRNHLERFKVLFSSTVQEHRENYAEDSPRDFVDVFLKEIYACKDEESPFFKEVGYRQLTGVIKDLFEAGSETSSTTLSWIFLYLSTFPEVQKKLQEEIDRVVGNSRHCGLSDRPNLPYAEAFLAEVLRFSSIVPVGVPHRALFDVVYKGYAFPKGTGIMANQHGIHHSTKIWGDPKNFRPERFLSPDGKTFKKHEAIIPFSIGRRQCAGETLARDTLFLYTTNICQRFEIKFDPNDAKANPGLSPKMGILLTPEPYKVIFKDRVD